MQGVIIILVILLLLLDYVLLRRLQAYVEQAYPQAWQQLRQPNLGNAQQAAKVNFHAALQSGHFAALNDNRIDTFIKRRRWLFKAIYLFMFIHIGWTAIAAFQA